jgi:CheY-like chemotaxis protein
MCPARDVQTSAIRDKLIVHRIASVGLWGVEISSQLNIFNKRVRIRVGMVLQTWLAGFCYFIAHRDFLDGRSIAKVQPVLQLRGLFMSKSRVLLADDNPAMLEKAASTLASEFDVVAAVHNGQEALEAAAQLDPDVVVLDISMPVLDGIKAAWRLRQSNSSAKIVFLTANQDALMCQAASETGALGYVTKLRLIPDLIEATKLALAGHRFVSCNVQ